MSCDDQCDLCHAFGDVQKFDAAGEDGTGSEVLWLCNNCLKDAQKL